MTGPFDDESVEPRSLDLPDGVVYCASCGTLFIFEQTRPCPTCEVAAAVEELDEALDGDLFGGLLTGGSK